MPTKYLSTANLSTTDLSTMSTYMHTKSIAH